MSLVSKSSPMIGAEKSKAHPSRASGDVRDRGLFPAPVTQEHTVNADNGHGIADIQH